MKTESKIPQFDGSTLPSRQDERVSVNAVFITKWSNKIVRAAGTLVCSGGTVYFSNAALGLFVGPKDYFFTEEAARADIEQRNQRRVILLQKQIKKLQAVNVQKVRIEHLGKTTDES